MLLNLNDFFTYPFLFKSLMAVGLLSLISGVLSPLVMVKRYAFLGEGISHSTLLGLTLAQILFQGDTITIFMATTFLTLSLCMLLAFVADRDKTPSDSLIGLFLTACLSLALMLNQMFPRSGQKDFMSFLFGNIYLMENSDIVFLAILFILAFLLMVCFKRQLLYFLFDPSGAHFSGINTRLIHYTLFAFLGLFIVLGAKVAGTILVNAFLLIPGWVALKLGKGPKAILLTSLFHAFFSSLIGLILTNAFDTPASATIALSQLFFAALFIAYQKIFR